MKQDKKVQVIFRCDWSSNCQNESGGRFQTQLHSRAARQITDSRYINYGPKWESPQLLFDPNWSFTVHKESVF